MGYSMGYSISSDTIPYPGMVWVGSDTIPFFWYGFGILAVYPTVWYICSIIPWNGICMGYPVGISIFRSIK